jgi:hypothetical protein
MTPLIGSLNRVYIFTLRTHPKYLLFFLLSFWSQFLSAKVWLHLELGGANYGQTVGTSASQYQILFQTFDSLVEKHGPHGIFYLNDLDLRDINFAIKALKEHSEKKQLTGWSFVALPGDYTQIEIPFVDSVHLTNPEGGAFPLDPYIGPENLAPWDLTKAKAGAESLEKISARSRTGLKITTGRLEAMEMIKGFLSSPLSNDGSGNSYISPLGEVLEETKVFWLNNSKTGKKFCPDSMDELLKNILDMSKKK